ncbi:MAG: winged helix-turn-helix transcriptional regulator [Candidatus Helarchaeota archaeon]|nr:winged helix-turn-helix transcriptional regulator [Candidatus Helarchaeota archaeon]
MLKIEKTIPNNKLPPLEEILSYKARIKIILLLVKVGELNITEIARRTNLNNKTCKEHLKYLTKVKVIQEKKYGKIRIYRLRVENPKIRSLTNFVQNWNSN